MRYRKKIIPACLGLILLTAGAFCPKNHMQASATQTRKQNFSSDYVLTGIGAQDILNVAVAQTGKTGRQLGYTEEWCADFIGDCADLAGQGNAVPHYGQVTGLKSRILAAGGKEITSSPQPGDIVLYKGHIEIVYSASGTALSTLKSMGGNTGSNSTLYTRVVSVPRVCGNVLSVVRPAYHDTAVRTWYDLQEPADLGESFYGRVKNCIFGWYLTNQDGNVFGTAEQKKSSQIWKFERQEDGSYKIISFLDDTCLDVNEAAESGSGSNIQTWRDNTGTDNEVINQRFFFYRMGNALYIRSACADFAVEMDLNHPDGNVTLEEYQKNFEPQKFEIEKIEPEDLPVLRQVSVDDAVRLKQYLQNEIPFTEEEFNTADWNQDGSVNIYDWILMKKQLIENQG